MLRTLRAPPQPGSVRESVLLMALMMEENIEHAKFRAAQQLQLDKDKGVEAFEEYMKIAFPYLDTVKRRDRAKFIEILQQELSRGPLRVSALAQPKLRSRLKQQQIRNRRTVPMTRGEEARLYSKLRMPGV